MLSLFSLLSSLFFLWLCGVCLQPLKTATGALTLFSTLFSKRFIFFFFSLLGVSFVLQSLCIAAWSPLHLTCHYLFLVLFLFFLLSWYSYCHTVHLSQDFSTSFSSPICLLSSYLVFSVFCSGSGVALCLFFDLSVSPLTLLSVSFARFQSLPFSLSCLFCNVSIRPPHLSSLTHQLFFFLFTLPLLRYLVSGAAIHQFQNASMSLSPRLSVSYLCVQPPSSTIFRFLKQRYISFYNVSISVSLRLSASFPSWWLLSCTVFEAAPRTSILLRFNMFHLTC